MASYLGRVVFLDLIRYVITINLIHIVNQALTNRLIFLGEHFTEIAFEEMIESEVDEHTKEDEQPRKKSRIPRAQPEPDGARAHAGSSAVMT